MQTATPTFIAESEKTTEGARPGVEIDIETASGTVAYGNRVTSVSDVDRVLEKYGEQGIGFAGDITFTLENTDGIFSAGNTSSPFEGQVRGRLISIYQFFYTKEPSIIPFMTTAKGMTTTVDMDEGTTEKLPQFVGKISRVITNDDRTVTITARDIIQDLVEAEMASTGLVNGNVADGLKTILEAAGFDVATVAYELLRSQTAGTHVARAWGSGDKAIDLVQDLNKACGTNVVASASGEMVMTQLFPHWGEFARYVYHDQSQEPEYSGEESDVGTDLNLISATGSGDETFTVNRVTYTFLDFDNVQRTIVYQVLSSILKYGIKNLPLVTGANIPLGTAHVWPTRILDRYNDEAATLYSLRASLRHASVAEVGDHVTLTEPSGMEVETFALITRASRNPFVLTAGLEFETQREMQDEKWAFAGDASPGGSERPSDIMDHVYNKSIEAVDPEGEKRVQGKALDFNNDTVNEYVDCGNNPTLELPGDFTMVGWCAPVTGSGWRVFLNKQAADNDRNYWVGLSAGAGGVAEGALDIRYTESGVGNTRGRSTSVLDDGAWHFWAIQFNAGTMRVFLDGVWEWSQASALPDVQTSSLILGRQSTAASNYYTGKMDSIAIWNRPLSDNDVVDLYKSGLGLWINPTRTFPTDGGLMSLGLKALYGFDTGSGSTVVDESGNENDGTMINMESGDWVDGKVVIGEAISDLPVKWFQTAGIGGEFLRSDDEARTGQYSGKVTAAGALSDQWEQNPFLVDLDESTQYTMSVYVKGGPPSAGSIGLEIVDSTGAVVAGSPLTISGTYATWTKLTVTFTTNASGPFYLRLKMNAFTGTYYLDDMQIDAGASIKDFQENWMNYAYAGEASDQAKPGFDLEGNNNGVINRDYFNGFEQEYVSY